MGIGEGDHAQQKGKHAKHGKHGHGHGKHGHHGRKKVDYSQSILDEGKHTLTVSEMH